MRLRRHQALPRLLQFLQAFSLNLSIHKEVIQLYNVWVLNLLHHLHLVNDLPVLFDGDLFTHPDLLESYHPVQTFLSALRVNVFLICFIDGTASSRTEDAFQLEVLQNNLWPRHIWLIMIIWVKLFNLTPLLVLVNWSWLRCWTFIINCFVFSLLVSAADFQRAVSAFCLPPPLFVSGNPFIYVALNLT